MTTFYRFIIALLSLALVLSLWQRGKESIAKTQAPDETAFVSRFGNAKNNMTAKELAQQAKELMEDSDIEHASNRLSKGA